MDKQKDKQKSKTTMVTGKLLQVASHEGVTELNILNMPFLLEYKGDPITLLDYYWFQKKDGRVIKRGIKVSGHGGYGVPTLKEKEVLLALQRIFIRKKSHLGVWQPIPPEEVTDEYLTIDYTINGLCTEMGYSTPNPRTRKGLEKSIEILVATTLFSTYEGGIYDAKEKEYVTNHMKAFHYLESLEGYSVADKNGNPIIDATKVRLSRFFYTSLVNNYKIYYNEIKRSEIKNLLAKDIYLHAVQRKKNNVAVFLMDSLMDKIQMKDNDNKYRKKDVLKKALDKIEQSKVANVTITKGKQPKVYIYLGNQDGESEIAVTNSYCFLDKFNKFKEIREQLLKYEFSEAEIDDLDVEKIKYIKALLRYMMNRNTYGKSIVNSYTFAKDYLKNEYPLPEEYYDS